MIYKVGQRVKRIGNTDADYQSVPVGAEGVVVSAEFRLSSLRLYDVKWNGAVGSWSSIAESLAPLTDPRAESFIADMARFAALSKKRCYPEVSTLTADDLKAITGGA